MNADPPMHVADALAADHYRAFEEPGEEARAFLAALEARTEARLAGPARKRIAAFLRRAMDYPVFGMHGRLPGPRGGEVAYLHHRAADAAQGTLARAAADDPFGADPEAVIDPAALDPSGITSLHGWWIAEDGRHAAYTLSQGGSDRQVLGVRDLATGEDLLETPEGIRFTNVAWAPDGRSFLYNRHLTPEEEAARHGEGAAGLHYRRFVVCRHRLGTDQARDEIVADWSDRPEMIVWPHRRRGSEAEFLQAARGTDEKGALLWRPAGSDEAWRLVQREGEADTSAIAVRRIDGGLTLFAFTDRDAPSGRVVAVDLEGDARPAAWRTVVPETDRALQWATVTLGHVLARYHTGTAHELVRHGLDGLDPTPVSLPGGEQSLAPWRAHPDAAEVFVLTSARAAGTGTLRLDPATLAVEKLAQPRSPEARPDAVTLRLDLEMDDGEAVPVSVAHPPDRPLGPGTPLLISAYGGFGVTPAPGFSPFVAAVLAMGGAFAWAHIRGGGERGRAWHEAARGPRRERAFDDLAGVVDALVGRGLASRGRVAIQGGSNGGLLVAAVLCRRPDLCGAVLCKVPVTDMLRFATHHAGPAWIPEYGDPDDPADAAVLRAYSPLHNVPAAPHPPILITTAENDDRVAPWHASKFAAALICDGASPERVHLAVERAAGHGFGRSREQIVEGDAAQLAFLAGALGMDPPN